MSRLLFCLSLLFTYSVSVAGGTLCGDSFPADTLSVLTDSDSFSDVPDGADADKLTVISADLSGNHRINNGQVIVRTVAYSHSDSHPDIHPIRAPPV